MVSIYIVIKHGTYLRGLTLKGKIACTKRLLEVNSQKKGPSYWLILDRITNPRHNFLMEYKVSHSVLSIRNYVIFLILDRFRRSTASSRYKKGNPKLTIRQNQMEFEMTRNFKELGLRRAHSTSLLIGKELSYTRFDKNMLLGIFMSDQLNILKSNIVWKDKCNNLSTIMSDSKFLIIAWFRIHSSQGGLILKLDKGVAGEINFLSFKEIANIIRNGKFKFFSAKKTHIIKSKGKQKNLIISSLKDKIVQEAMRYLLELVFKNSFSKNFYGWVSERSSHMALNKIKTQFNQVNWFIKVSIDQQISLLNHEIIINILKEKIEDQAFIDLIYKYLRVGYGRFLNCFGFFKTGIYQDEILLPILLSIYMLPFDNWVETYLKLKYNLDHIKAIRSNKTDKHFVQTVLLNNSFFFKFHYIHYMGNFFMGVCGSKNICKKIILECEAFLVENLKLTLNTKKTKIIFSQYELVLFLGYCIYKVKQKKKKLVYNLNNKFKKKNSNIVLNAPLDIILKKIIQKGFATKEGNPTRNGKLINYTLYNIVDYYMKFEKGIIQYYSLANNFDKLVSRVHYILKYSCALTIASKMKLKTLRKVFNKYGKDINIKDGSGLIKIHYPRVKHKKFKRIMFNCLDFNDYIEQLDRNIIYQKKRFKRFIYFI